MSIAMWKNFACHVAFRCQARPAAAAMLLRVPTTITKVLPNYCLDSFSGVRGMATKKQGGSSGNGRDSAGRRLGIKLYEGAYAKAGAIVIRQRGCKWRAGDNAAMGKDHTVFATQPGRVQFTRHPYHKKKRHIVSIMEETAWISQREQNKREENLI
jgi:large subunit ribosomal protein L27